jgi:hypothetical protein
MKTDIKKLCWSPLLFLWAFLSATETQAAAPIPLRAGPVTMVFEPDNAFLRYVKVGPHEILRGITAPVRNQFWGTVLPVVSKIELVDKGDQFTLTFEALCREREIDFLWHGTIKGSASGEIEYTFDGTARSTFQRNRIGFCVLHGPSASLGSSRMFAAKKPKDGFPSSSRRISRLRRSGRSDMNSRRTSGRTSEWKGTRSRWRTNATGPTRLSRRIARRWSFPIP